MARTERMASGSAVAPLDTARAGRRERFRPILKWAGGKARLLPEILPLLPDRIETYYEPFVGGGAVFFALASERRFRRAVLSDLNAELVDVYRGIKKDVEAVIRLLERYRKKHDAELYYRTRELQPQNIHVAQVVIDGGIYDPAKHPERLTSRGPDGNLDPDAIAQTYLHLHHQHRSSWASHIELRPWVEKF